MTVSTTDPSGTAALAAPAAGAEGRPSRRLAVVLSADVAGYSALTEADDEAAFAALGSSRAIFDAQVRARGGRVFGAYGDSLMAEFGSAVEATRAALAIQREMALAHADAPAGRRMAFRVGITLGDVIVEGENLYGEAVNLAARLQALAEPGGICVSGPVRDLVQGKVALELESIGEPCLRNLRARVQAYRARTTREAAARDGRPGIARVVGTAPAWPPPRPAASAAPGAPQGGAVSILRTLARLFGPPPPPAAGIPLLGRTGGAGLDRPAAVPTWPEPLGAAVAGYAPGERTPGPSVAVLPFRVLPACAAGDEGCGEVLAEEVAAALARFRWLVVVSSGSARAVARMVADPAEAGRQLDVRYVLAGVVRRAERRARLCIELIESASARTCCTERLEIETSELTDLPAVVTEEVAARIAPQMLAAETRRARRMGPESLGPAEAFLHSIPLVYELDRSSFSEARLHLERAIVLDPSYASPHAWLAFWHVLNCGQGWARDRKAEVELAARHAAQAVELDPDDAAGLALYGHVEVFLHHRYEHARQLSDRALEANPGMAMAWALGSALRSYLGDPGEAIARMERFRRLSPLDPHHYFFELIDCVAHLVAGRYEHAALLGKRSVSANPRFTNGYKPLVAALGLLDRRAEAAPYRDELLRLEPEFSVTLFRRVYPLRDACVLETYAEGLRRAGVPEE